MVLNIDSSEVLPWIHFKVPYSTFYSQYFYYLSMCLDLLPSTHTAAYVQNMKRIANEDTSFYFS